MAVHGFISRVCKFKKNLYVQVVKCVRTGDWRQCVCVCGATAVSSVSHVPLTAKSCSLPWFNILTKIAAGDMCAVLKGRIWKLYFFQGVFWLWWLWNVCFVSLKGSRWQRPAVHTHQERSNRLKSCHLPRPGILTLSPAEERAGLHVSSLQWCLTHI